MIATPQLAALVDLADRNVWRIVLVGDPHQLAAVGRSGIFRHFCEAGEVAKASLYAGRAGRNAIDKLAFEEAVGYLTVGVASLDRQDDPVAHANPSYFSASGQRRRRPRQRSRHGLTAASQATPLTR